MFDIEIELKKLPNKPGVYIMHDKNDKIIYVGKAINLKRRVTSYFRKTNKTQRIINMVSLIDHFEYIVCDNEAEALILECNLIKKNMPKFNVLLKDGKTYPYIKVNVKADFPDIYITRRILNDGAKYFGPYASAGSAKEMVDFIKSKFKVRQCKSYKYKDRPCLNYHIKRCPAPCMGYITKEEYRKTIDKIISVLEGKTSEIEKTIKEEMLEASSKQEFEKAANLRDELIAIERISQKQKVSNISENDIDVLGLYKANDELAIQVFNIRASKMIGRENYFFAGLNDEDDSEIISEFIERYYSEQDIIPNKIMCRYDFEDRKLFEEWLTKKAGRKVEIKIPQKGEKLKLVEMCENNAKITLDNKQNNSKAMMLELKDVLGLEKIPHRIESYDISNISGEYQVAAMCVMLDGEIKKQDKRRFKVKTVLGQNDPKSMEEVVTRRLRHSVSLEDIKDNKEFISLDDETKSKYDEKYGKTKLPDLILADGGITQIKATIKAISNVEKEVGIKLNIGVYGMVKNDKHQTRALMDKDRHEIQISNELFNLITNFQNEVHNEAIGYHKLLRNKSMTKSDLDEIKGIGESKKKVLLKEFGSVEKIKNAKVEELTKIKGINEKLAEEIKKSLEEI